MKTRRLVVAGGLACGVAGLALAMGPSIDINGGRFTIASSDEYNTFGTYNYARVEMLGGLVNSLKTFDNSTFEMREGRINILQNSGSSRFTLHEGDVGFLVSLAGDATFAQVGGSVEEGFLAFQDVHLEFSGGTIGEYVFAGGRVTLEIAARSFRYDHDGDPTTPNIPIEFGDAYEIVLNRDTITAYSDDLMTTRIYGLTPTWGDGSTTSFDVSGGAGDAEYPDDPCRWTGTLTLIRYHAADFTADRAVDVDDLAVLLAAWGACDVECPADFNADGVVDTRDLAFVLANWG